MDFPRLRLTRKEKDNTKKRNCNSWYTQKGHINFLVKKYCLLGQLVRKTNYNNLVIKLFACFPTVSCFPALTARYAFPRAFHWFHVSRAYCLLRVFPRFPLVSCLTRLLPVTRFPALSIGLMSPALTACYAFSRAFHWFNVSRAYCLLRVFPRFPLVSCLTRLLPVTRFPALSIGLMSPALTACYAFSRAFHWFNVSRAYCLLRVFPRFPLV